MTTPQQPGPFDPQSPQGPTSSTPPSGPPVTQPFTGPVPGQPYGQPLDGQRTKRPVWKTVVGVLLAVWTVLAVLGRLGRLGNGNAMFTPSDPARFVGQLLAVVLFMVVPAVLSFKLLTSKR